MRAMLLERVGAPLRWRELEERPPSRGKVLVDIEACGVCRTDLHVADGELEDPRLPLILGHEIVGRVAALGEALDCLRRGEVEGAAVLLP